MGGGDIDGDSPRVAKESFSADYHQQYLAKNPNGYCRIGGCQVPCKSAQLQLGQKVQGLASPGFFGETMSEHLCIDRGRGEHRAAGVKARIAQGALNN
jgi:hypothetical protein